MAQGGLELSWFDRALIETSASGIAKTAAAAGRSEHELRRIGGLVGLSADRLTALGGNLRDLDRHLNLQLRTQTDAFIAQTEKLLEVLQLQAQQGAAQVKVLTEIRDAQSRPGKIRASECLLDAGELLRRGRWRRALERAEAAIADDPNNADAFWAAGLSLVGLERLSDAQAMLEEAAAASDAEAAGNARRWAARLAMQRGLVNEAVRLASRAAADLPPTDQRGQALMVERIVYAALAGDATISSRLFSEAGYIDWQLCEMVLSSPHLDAVPETRIRLRERLRDELAVVSRLYSNADSELRALKATIQEETRGRSTQHLSDLVGEAWRFHALAQQSVETAHLTSTRPDFVAIFESAKHLAAGALRVLEGLDEQLAVRVAAQQRRDASRKAAALRQHAEDRRHERHRLKSSPPPTPKLFRRRDRAGWYEDPIARAKERYWDGSAWTYRIRDERGERGDPLGDEDAPSVQ